MGALKIFLIGLGYIKTKQLALHFLYSVLSILKGRWAKSNYSAPYKHVDG